MKRKLAVEELKKTFAVLNADVEELKNMTGESLTAFGVRSTIRTFSALMEGLLYQMRQVALDSCDSSNEIYNAEELMVLREKAVYLDNAGLIKLFILLKMLGLVGPDTFVISATAPGSPGCTRSAGQ